MKILRDQFNEKHIIKDGARFHVHSYSGIARKNLDGLFALTWCSEPFCEDNFSAIMTCIDEGYEPAKLASNVALKNWLQSPDGAAALRQSRNEDKHD